MSMEINELDELSSKLQQISDAVQNLSGQCNAPIDDLLNESFLLACSKCASLDELLVAGGLVINSIDDFEAIPIEQLNELVVKHTSYKTWNDMLDEATEAYATKTLGL